MRLSRNAAAGRLTRSADPADLLYGALVAASVLATASAHAEYRYVAIATLLVLGVYWLAHVYIEAQSLQLRGDARHYLGRLGHTAAREASIIQGGLPAVIVFALCDAFGATTTTAASVAVYFSVGVLALVGYLAAHQAGRRGVATLVDSFTAALLGVVVIVAKALLH